ncbi:MAG: hypothetical protein ACRC7S_19635 [Cetobacterium sp.]
MGEIEEIYEEFEPRKKMMYHIVDGEFRGWIYKDLEYGVELTSENGYFEIEDDLYNKLEQERILNNMVTVYDSENKILKNISWEEQFEENELEEMKFRAEVRFYNQELEFASKAVAELKCDIISPEDFEDVKVYMQSIDPYAQTYKSRDRKTRPDIFNRYQ